MDINKALDEINAFIDKQIDMNEVQIGFNKNVATSLTKHTERMNGLQGQVNELRETIDELKQELKGWKDRYENES